MGKGAKAIGLIIAGLLINKYIIRRFVPPSA